ncbi:MAG: Endoglucanase, partial [Candidatus Ordinivivax streblomastigis]
MKHKIQLVIFVGIALFTVFFSISACDNHTKVITEDTTFVGKHGQLSVKGVQLVDKNGEALVLNGVSFGWHVWFSKFYNKETVAWLHSDWKANIVRAA